MLNITKEQIKTLNLLYINTPLQKRKRQQKLIKLSASGKEKLDCEFVVESENHGTLKFSSKVIGYTKDFILLKGGDFISFNNVAEVRLV